MADDVEESGAAASPSLEQRLQEYLLSIRTTSINNGAESSVGELVTFLNSICAAALSNPDNEDLQNNALQVLTEFHSFLSSSDDEAVDALSLELPKVISVFAALSHECSEIANAVINLIVETCNPRDMLSILCEALDSPSGVVNMCGHVLPLLTGLSKVFLRTKKRHYKQIKVAIPVILNVFKQLCLEFDAEDGNLLDLFHKALLIVDSISTVCDDLEGREWQKLHCLLCLFVFQIMALISISWSKNMSSCLHVISKLSCVFPMFSISYIGLITGYYVPKMMYLVIKAEDDDSVKNSFCFVRHGAYLSVIWGHVFDDVAKCARENMSCVMKELQINQMRRWEAISMSQYVISSARFPFETKNHVIEFLRSCFTNKTTITESNQDVVDHSMNSCGLCGASQAIACVLMSTPAAPWRKNAFELLRSVLADTPIDQRLDIFRILIVSLYSSSMVAILLDLLRKEMYMEIHETRSSVLLWKEDVLDLVERVLRLPKGGPQSLREFSDAVLAALNLYRFILLVESSGKTNYTKVMCKSNLRKAYDEWLLPLRHFVTVLLANCNRECNVHELADTAAALNPVQLVLCRCIELVDDHLN